MTPALDLPSTHQRKRTPGVLVVDDDDVVRRFVESALTSAGYQVYVATNLTEAVALFKQVRDKVHIALLDVSMPGGNGPDVLTELRLIQPNLPIAFMSGELDLNLTNSLADHLCAVGADGMIAKPMIVADLRRVLESALYGREHDREPSPKMAASH